MPFTYLAETHSCEKPTHRDDNSPLRYGDMWQCDTQLDAASKRFCGKIYRWEHNQREGAFWMPSVVHGVIPGVPRR